MLTHTCIQKHAHTISRDRDRDRDRDQAVLLHKVPAGSVVTVRVRSIGDVFHAFDRPRASKLKDYMRYVKVIPL